MKKFCATMMAAMLLTGGAMAEQNLPTISWDSLTQDTAIAYSDIYSEYYDALQDLDSGSLTDEQQEELMSEFLLAKDCGGFSYNIVDLDGNGTPELIIAVKPTDDTYFGKMILEMYTVNENGEFKQVLKSGERSRYYYAGDNRIAYVGSNGADDSIDTTYVYENGALTDTGVATDPANYVQMELVPEEDTQN